MKELTVAASLENIPVVTAFIDEQLEAVDCPMKAKMQIDIVIDELFGNIARYAYGDGTGDATVQFEFDGPTRTASVTFVDGGIPFNPLQKPDPDVTLAAEERAIGGLGIFMVKKTMDRLEYSYENGLNILKIHKCIG